ncbi:hypothetical protein CLOM621_05778 [Clostridium sp. M62/1]|nr:hypothetical protein CLOM621_05778 [Clostridium sp. M62/1]
MPDTSFLHVIVLPFSPPASGCADTLILKFHYSTGTFDCKESVELLLPASS